MKIKIFKKIFIFLTIPVFIIIGISDAAQNEINTNKIYKYFLGPEDQMEISVWQDDSLEKTVVIRPDGKISYPLAGDVMASGKTVEEFQQMIQNKIREYIPKAVVTVMVTTVASPKVYVVGEVINPGAYIMGRPLRVMQLLALAGGIAEYAEKNGIIIIRDKGDMQKVFKFEYTKFVKGKNIEQNIILSAGDTIVVP